MSGQPPVILFNEFSPDNVKYMPPKRNSNGGYSVFLTYNNDGGDHEIIVQGPRVRVPFGVSTYEADQGRKNLSIDLSLDGYKTIDSAVKKFFETFSTLDKRHKSTAAANSQTWFGKPIEKNVLDEFYKSPIRESKDPDRWAPTMKVKIPQSNNEVACELYDEKQNPIGIDQIQGGVEIIPVISCSRLWFM